MLQIVNGRTVYVVEFNTMPELPITGLGIEHPYAVALTSAIEDGTVTEPGKYGIHVDRKDDQYIYNIFRIEE